MDPKEIKFTVAIGSNNSGQSITDQIRRIFDRMNLSLSADTPLEHMDCSTLAGNTDAFLKTEVMSLVTIAEDLTVTITYEEIRTKRNHILDIKERYSDISNICLSTYIKNYGEDVPYPPIDETIEVNKSGLWINDIHSKMLIWHSSITEHKDLLIALHYKYKHLANVCDAINNMSMTITSNKESCCNAYEHSLKNKKLFVDLAAKKFIDGQDLSTAKKKKKVIETTLKRIQNRPLSAFHQLGISNKNDFAYFIANTEGISEEILQDYLIDVAILKMLNSIDLQYPWLKDAYYDRIQAILDMLKEAYSACINAFKISPSNAYSILWVWMRDYLKIIRTGEFDGIKAYTATMNLITTQELKNTSIANAISKTKDNQNLFEMFKIFAIKANILTYKNT